MKLELAYHDDGKGKYQSHEVRFFENGEDTTIPEKGIYGIDITYASGYGETKEEAFNNFKESFQALMQVYKEFEEKLIASTVDDMPFVEVDCLGKKVER